jgi:hypothetical protein
MVKVKSAPSLMVDIYINTGEWIQSLQGHMSSAVDGTCFHLPTDMHHHAFWLVKNNWFPERDFKVIVEKTEVAK